MPTDMQTGKGEISRPLHLLLFCAHVCKTVINEEVMNLREVRYGSGGKECSGENDINTVIIYEILNKIK